MHVYQFSIFFLGATSVLCLIGLASPRFHDNLFMCVGMALLAIGDMSRVADLWQRTPVDVFPWDWFFVHAGMGMFAIGITFDTFLKERKRRFAAFAESTIVRARERLHISRFGEMTNPPLARNSADSRNHRR